MLLAVFIGAVTGLIVFSITRITGRNLFLITGGIAGAAAILTLQLYWRTARLSEVKITVPQVSELTFVVNNDARQAAWKFYIETVTRVSTQPLSDEEGLIAEALSSLYGLFATTRETLKNSRPSVPVSGGQTVEHLAVTMLNHELRPFLSKWHPRLTEFENSNPGAPESAWPQGKECRAELRGVQSNLLGFALGFARLAGVRGAEVALVPRQRDPAGANLPPRVPRTTRRLRGEQGQDACPRVVPGLLAVLRGVRPPERVVHPRIAHHLMAGAGRAQRGGDLLALLGGDQEVVLADQVQQASLDARCQVDCRGRLAQRYLRHGQPSAV